MYHKFKHADVQIDTCGNWLKIKWLKSTIIVPWLAFLAMYESCIRITDSLIHVFRTDYIYNRKYFKEFVQIIDICIQSVILLGRESYQVLKGWYPAIIGRILTSEHEGFVN